MKNNLTIGRLSFIVLGLLFVFMSACKPDDDEPQSVERFQGFWTGTYEGIDNGTWSATIDNSGNITGSLISLRTSRTFTLSGVVSPTGDFNATAGTTTVGATFKGKLGSDSGEGTWENQAIQQTGTWSGQKELGGLSSDR